MVIPQPATRQPLTLREKRQMAGRLGGLQTALRYSHEQRQEWGKCGGRPRLPSIEELRQRAAPKIINENGGRPPDILAEVGRLLDLRQGRRPLANIAGRRRK